MRSVRPANRSKTLVWALSIPLAALGASLSPATACTCPFYSPSDHVASVDAIFSGTVTSISQRAAGGLMVTVDVDQVFKGETDGGFTVPNLDGDLCGWRFEEGARTVVFARRFEGQLSTGNCLQIPFYSRGSDTGDYDAILPGIGAALQ